MSGESLSCFKFHHFSNKLKNTSVFRDLCKFNINYIIFITKCQYCAEYFIYSNNRGIT